jgi:hypothetical protein
MLVHVLWTAEAAGHMLTRHAVSPEATRCSMTLLTVILLPAPDGWLGVNGWVTKSGRDRTAYRKTNE